MSTITLPNIRVGSDLQIGVRLKDGGVAIDWSTLSNIKACIYSDAQRALAGRCAFSIDEEDSTLLVCTYAANKPQYLGVNRIVISAKYMGETKTYDKPAFTFVRWTADQEGEEITIDDPDVDVEIDVEDISSSILQEAVDAAFTAADRANDAAAAAEHMVDIHTGPDGKSAYEVAVEEGYTGTEEEWLASLVGPQGAQGIQGETGEAAGFGSVSAALQEDGGDPSVVVAASGEDTSKNFAFTFKNLKGDKGDKGDQGNTGSSVDYPYELVNNLTTDDATKGLTAAQGKVLDGKVSQLEAKVTELDIQVNGEAEDTADVTLAVTAGTGVTTSNSLKECVLSKDRTYNLKLTGVLNTITIYFRSYGNTDSVSVEQGGASRSNLTFTPSITEYTIKPLADVYYVRFYAGAANITQTGDMVFNFDSPETVGLVQSVEGIENDIEGLGTRISTVDDNINERIDTELYDTELLTADSSSQSSYDTEGNPVTPSILDTYFYDVSPGDILDLDYIPFSSAGYSVIQAWNDTTFVESILNSKVEGYGTIRYVVPEGVNKIGCTYYTNNVHNLTSKIETLSKEIDAVDDKVDESAFVKTRNVWPIETTVTVTETNVVYGVQGTTIIPAGTYIISYEAIRDSGTVTAVVTGYDSQGAVGILYQIGPTNGRNAKGVVFERDIDRLLFKTYNNNVGEIVLKDIQLEAIDWMGYTSSPNKGNWDALPYGTEFIKQVVPVSELVGTCKSYWEGKKINYNGDSVTQGIGTSRIGYAKVVNQALKFGTVRNYAIGGTRLAHIEDVVNCLVDRIEDMSLDADIVFIMANTNDYASQVPIGNSDSVDESTYNGALNSIFTWLKTNYPTQPIIISTMLTRKVNYDEDSQPLPITIEQYADAVRQKVAEYGFILYDAYKWSGLDQLNTPKDGTGISDDGLHPNEAGALALGRKVAKFIDAQ